MTPSAIPCPQLSRPSGMLTPLPQPTETPKYLGRRGQPLHIQKDRCDFWRPSDFLWGEEKVPSDVCAPWSPSWD